VVALLVLLLAAGPLSPAGAQGQDYLLGPGDVLLITVLGESDLSRTVTVRSDGKISLPLVGEVQVIGLTTSQVAERLTTALRVYLKRPQVTITLSQGRAEFIYLVGQVRNPGAYQMGTGWTALEAITNAGGVTEKAALKRATVVRRTSPQAIPLDLERLIRGGDRAADLPLTAGDVIFVPLFENRVMVWGNVRSPGFYDVNEGARVLDALAMAGGPATKAALGNVGVIRQVDGQRKVVAVVDVNKILSGAADQAANIALQHADIVYVPQDNRVTWQDVLSWVSGFGIIRSLFGF
jgi:polysaccharide export outer membrane protein